jgi:hypothetical protein
MLLRGSKIFSLHTVNVYSVGQYHTRMRSKRRPCYEQITTRTKFFGNIQNRGQKNVDRFIPPLPHHTIKSSVFQSRSSLLNLSKRLMRLEGIDFLYWVLK